ncbi:lantibiotic dehydratase [Nocardiopsis sp. CNT312]|uniref:lantibiotic dehydratase n=1 Tax=Nocardiopsis sp. CNT312 TaxID=1137268 RepID=UPI00048FEDC3|nr:lantibiotic dehydratase [Nocardiopsis sp. CNT312]
MAKRSPRAYEWSGGALLRASTSPEDLDVPEDLVSEHSPARGLEWLARLWERREVRDALSAANPGLCSQITGALSGRRLDDRRVRKTLLSVVSYLARWERPTPFGLFAGTAPVSIGAAAHTVWGDGHRVALRADSEWLSDIIARLHRCPALVERLHVAANNTGQVRGARYVVPGQSADGHSLRAAPVEVSVRHSPPVALALEIARTPVRYERVREHLTLGFPHVAGEQITALLEGLIDQHLLLTDLWAPMSCTDALAHLCDTLAAVRAENIDEIADLVADLHTVRSRLAHPVRHTAWSERVPVLERMRELSDVAPVPVIADTVLDCRLALPERVVRTVEEAADVLTRLTPEPFGSAQWRDYHARFRARYGAGAVVPVLELVADSGLGWPAGYLGASRGRPPRMLSERDHTVLRLVQQAQAAEEGEIVLTDSTVTALGPGSGEEVLPPPRVEVCVQIHAPTPRAIEKGAYTVAVTGAPRPASSMAGRFAHLLPEEDHEALAHGFRSPEAGTVTAQLTFPPRKRRNENITRTSRLLPHIVPLAEHHPPGPDVIGVDDIAVSADAHRFHLLRLSTGQRLELRVPHALEAGTHTPPLARFLAEVANARHAVYGGFDFGAAAQMPFLPRVRYGNIVLSPARWRLDARDLPRFDQHRPVWDEGFDRWRARWHVPDRAALVEHDRHLPLDLSHPVHRHLLRQRLAAHGQVELRETATREQVAWLGRSHELLFPLRASGSGSVHRTGPVRPVCVDAAHLPGSSVTRAHLYAHPDRFDEILTGHLPALTSLLPDSALWWFRRHRDLSRPDADRYLELYLRLGPEHSGGSAVEQVHAWARDLRHQRLLAHLELAAYEPQTGRFGHGEAMEAAEAVFAADSAAALAQIRAAQGQGVDPLALTAASIVDLATGFTDTPETGLVWLTQDLAHTPGPVDRAVRSRALDLASPAGESLLRLDGVAEAWAERASALSGYRKRLAAERDPHSVLRSLVHLHHVRALEIGPDSEAATIRTARAIALFHTEWRSP